MKTNSQDLLIHNNNNNNKMTTTVKLQWVKEPPGELVVSLGQELKVECLAEGEPKPVMRWEKLDSLQSHSGGGNSLQRPRSKLQQSSQLLQTGGYLAGFEAPSSPGSQRSQLALAGATSGECNFSLCAVWLLCAAVPN